MFRRNRSVTLIRHVAGRPLDVADFSVAVRPLPVVGEGQILVRSVALSIDPYLRGRMTGIDNFYLPQFMLGAPITSLGVGRVVESRNSDFAEGDLVQGLLAWSDYSIWSGAGQIEGGGVLRRVDSSIGKPSHALGVFGLGGLTAFFGILGVARPEPADTVVISGAAGGIGSLAGQIARILGARVIGLAGSQRKRDALVNELGFDAALDYRAPDLADQLRVLLPRGPDIYFDNVGGAVSQTVMGIMRRHARVVECGQISTYDDAGGGWTVDIRPVHANGLRWEGFTTAHFQEFTPAAIAQLAYWVREKKIIPLETEYRGLAAAPQAMVGIMRGENLGKMVVTIPEGREAQAGQDDLGGGPSAAAADLIEDKDRFQSDFIQPR
jgi:NADPH-dependent curcumin reductase CurA